MTERNEAKGKGTNPGRRSRVTSTELTVENRRYREALKRIARWHGEFPDATGRDGEPMSYGAAYGSNGERDFMRQVATDALSQNNQAHP